jgi:hypothetical protein
MRFAHRKHRNTTAMVFPEATVEIPNPESGCEFPEVLVKFQR